MTVLEYLEILSNDSKNPIYFIDLKTEQILFINQVFKEKLKLYDDLDENLCNEILAKHILATKSINSANIEQGHFFEQEIYSKTLNINLRTKSTIINVQDLDLLMVKFFLTSKDKKQLKANQNFEEAMTESLVLLALPDKNESIQAFLELLGKFYSCESTFVYEFNKELTGIDKVFNWSANVNEITPLEPSDNSALLAFIYWLQTDNEFINIESIDQIENEHERVFFEMFNISNITLNKIWNNDGTLRGVVGMNNRLDTLFDDRLLKAITLFITERFNEVGVENALKNINETDLLTGFFNRNKYAEKLTEIHTNPPKQLGVIFVNLNGLKQTNESFGFEVGDNKIKSTSKILKEFFNNDFFRISGDEFVGFIQDISLQEFEEKISSLQDKLKQENKESEFAIGHAFEEGKYSVTNLIKVADTVMTINKQAFYSENFKETQEVSNLLLQELFQAIAQDEFMVYLQPQLELSTEKVIGAEALIRRFDKKQQKMIFPDQFIPLYEKNSIIRHIDLFVIRRVCQLLQSWKHFDKEYLISVNLSRVTLLEYGIVKTISEILDEYDISHSLIVIEVTERIGLIENEVTTNLVEEFKEAGFKISLDDFGCAYSNIITLAQISVDEVKIDKSLVDNVLVNEKNRVIVKYMLTMCHELKDTSTLAEGIETKEQADFLRSVNCHLGQGYLYSRPIPDDEFFEKYVRV